MDATHRQLAPFGDDIWQAIERVAVAAARERLTARRFLDVDGPFGLGLTSIELGNDGFCRQPDEGEAAQILGRAVSVPMLRKSFSLSLRRLAGHLDGGQPLDLRPAEDAAEAVARREEELIYVGQPDFGLPGLLTAPGRCHRDGGDWARMDQALADVLAAVTALDEAGYPGPYALVLEPRLFNGLFRRYEDSDLLQSEHLGRLCTRGIFKAAVKGGAVVDPRVGRIIVGEDLTSGFSFQDGVHAHLYLMESLVLRLDDPRAVCTLGPAQAVSV